VLGGIPPISWKYRVWRNVINVGTRMNWILQHHGHFWNSVNFDELLLYIIKRRFSFSDDIIKHGRFYIGAGGNCPKPRPYPQMWHETLFDELKASVYRYKEERSVAFKIRQNAFPFGTLSRAPLRELTTLPRLSSRLEGHTSCPNPKPFSITPVNAHNVMTLHDLQMSMRSSNKTLSIECYSVTSINRF